MNEYTLSPETARLLRLHQKATFAELQAVTEQEFEKTRVYEWRQKRLLKKLYKPVTKDIQTETYIIPSSNGNETGYLFKKNDSKATVPALIIYFHEGGWMIGNMDCCKAVCSNICNVTECAVLAVDYRLSIPYKFPVPVEDCYSAFLWAEQGARYWKTDPSKIFLMGSGAGANLAIAVSRMSRDRKGPKIAGVIVEDPITDCRLKTESMETHKNNPVLSKKTLEFFISNYQREPKDILSPLFSPLLGLDHSRLPETLIFASEWSPLHDDAYLYANALQSADTAVKVIDRKGKFHCFMKYPDSDRWEDEMAAICAFIEGRPVTSISLLTRKQRAKLRRTKVRLNELPQ